MINEIAEDSFESKVLKAEPYILLYMYAPWCTPCKSTTPILDKLSEEYDAEEVTFLKLDIDKNPELVGSLGIRGIPALLLFKDGKAPARMIGMFKRAQLINFLNKNT